MERWRLELNANGFAPLTHLDGYLPLEHFGLIGDGNTAALVSRDGSIAWLCVPRLDSPPIFARILDTERGGQFALTPEDIREARQYYEEDTAVLVTEVRTGTGLVRFSDALALKSGADLAEDTRVDRSEFIRHVEVLSGEVRLRLDVDPMGGADIQHVGDGYRIHCRERPEIDLRLYCPASFQGLPSSATLGAGQQFHVCLTWAQGTRRTRPLGMSQLLDETRAAWKRWMRNFNYEGPQEKLVRRSTITLKLMDYMPNGAIVAAPTSSLPEEIGGVRNWDYRYVWIRDAAFSVYALRRIGFTQEATAFLGWVLDATERGERPRVLFNLDGHLPADEREDDRLEGYRKSRPVRWGNAAADQRQHDVYGEIMDCAYQWLTWGGEINDHLWGRFVELIDGARREWDQPDHGIWEVRTSGDIYTYSAAMCQVALDRGARLAERLGLPGDVAGWRGDAERIKQEILRRAWNERKQALAGSFGGEGLDASLLSLPLRRVLPADDPRMVATTAAIERELGVGDGLLLRYKPEELPDGLPGDEGAFLLCSFWLVDNLTGQGRIDEALKLYDSLCARAGELGLLPEQIDAHSGAFLGNYPQAFSHIGVISSGVNLARHMAGAAGRASRRE